MQLEFDTGYSLDSLVERSIELLRFHQPKDRTYWGCFSGGKDSVVIKELARMAGINVEWHYSVTTIDPPELVRFIKRHHGDVIWDRYRVSFFTRMFEKKMPPTRIARWRCDDFKESREPKGSTIILGIRAEESAERSKRWREYGQTFKGKSFAVCPILFWRSIDVWNFISSNSLPYCELYDEGWKRLGCIGCPMARNKKRDFDRWPGYEKQWRRAVQRLFDAYGSERFRSADEWWEWWMNNDEPLPAKFSDCQFFDQS